MKKTLLTMAALAVMAAGAQAAVLVEWDTTGFAGTETSIAAANVASNIGVTSIGLGAELLTTAGGGGMNTSSWSTALNGSSGNYYGFSVTVNSGYTLTLTDLLFTGRSSNTGPGNFAIRYSGDSFASNLDTFSTLNDTYVDFTLDLSGVGTLAAGTYEFRIGITNDLQSDGVGTVATGGTHRIMNPGSTSTSNVGADPISLNGTVTAVPEPTAAMLLGGAGMMLWLLRRKRVSAMI